MLWRENKKERNGTVQSNVPFSFSWGTVYGNKCLNWK